MTIGSFSMLTGLSIATLRHYDEIDLLKPRMVDLRTGYRRYAHAQVSAGRQIRLLRSAELSTTQIATILEGDEAVLGDVLKEYRAAVRERSAHVQALLDKLLGQVGDEGAEMTTASEFRLIAVNIGVDTEEDLEAARRFWGAVLGTDLEDWGAGSQQVVLGHGDGMGFLNIRVRRQDEPHRGDVSAFGLSVPGLEEVHARAVDAGGVEIYGPTDGHDMPRHSLVADPVGNRAVLWEGGD